MRRYFLFILLIDILESRMFHVAQNSRKNRRHAEKLFEKIKKDTTICEDTYHKKEKINGKWIDTNEIEVVTPRILALRLRNAVSHDHLIIQPLSPGKDKPIAGIEFSDKPTRIREAKREYFRLVLTIPETEILVKALSELLLSCYPR